MNLIRGQLWSRRIPKNKIFLSCVCHAQLCSFVFKFTKKFTSSSWLEQVVEWAWGLSWSTNLVKYTQKVDIVIGYAKTCSHGNSSFPYTLWYVGKINRCKRIGLEVFYCFDLYFEFNFLLTMFRWFRMYFSLGAKDNVFSRHDFAIFNSPLSTKTTQRLCWAWTWSGSKLRILTNF